MKIFLPTSIYETKESCLLYGEIVRDGTQSDAYYVIEAQSKQRKGDCRRSHLRCIASITNARVKKTSGQLCFRYDENTPNIYLDPTRLSSISSNVNVFLYEPHEFVQIAETKQRDDIGIIKRLLQESRNEDAHSQQKPSSIRALLVATLNLPLHLMTSLFIFIMESKVAMKLLQRTAFHEHYKEWRKFHYSRKRNWNIALDKILGILVMLFLIFYVPEPTDHVITTSHLVIDELRLLLRSLKGIGPIGLKLNVHLNNFFFDCFGYHIDLWATFLSIIEPAVQQIFIPITLLGSMGLSCQLALFADIISIVGLHAHCFYIYAAALYKVEIQGLAVLWKVVRGKRFNLIKKRVESHNYKNRQLYLATIFFTTLLFLFPTILVYYVVFTTLRLCTVSVTWLLKTLRRRILEFPLEDLYEWCRNNYRDRDSIHIKYLECMARSAETPEYRVCVFKIHVKSSSLMRVFSSESGVLKELTTNEDLSLKHLFKRILEGKF